MKSIQILLYDAIFQHKNFCKAGNILSAYKAEELGLQEKAWLLPRKLVAYTRVSDFDVWAYTFGLFFFTPKTC